MYFSNSPLETDCQNLIQLQEQIRSCRLCEAEFGFEPHPIVFGNLHAKIMQISQAPSRTVHQTGKPFNDASGRRLRQEWYKIPDKIFYNPDYFYIVSVAHCYPGKGNAKGDRRPPKCCADRWLVRELSLVQNEIYILIGSTAAAHFFPHQKLTDLVFYDQNINGKTTYVLPHPSPLNMRWFQLYPEFLEKRIPQIRAALHEILEISSVRKSRKSNSV